ncbi:uncharacterized protein LOC128034953 [Gossypium raimondii]|uniref:uncharacterized protein LOC128034953 n=1 Tax=Gossypium raimondii TaxID=29730 RepID=UPI00227AC290|nr:uncharacterized protein LOC128034953 [Gossypium raimondii]
MEKQEVEQLDAPIILAVKGQTRKTVAYELAKHLKYPVIDQDEITLVLQNSECLDNISFKIALSIASIQLKELKLGVIISTPLSQKEHLDNLKKQAKSAGAFLVIIQCLPKDGSNDFNIEGVPRLIVDPTKPTFDAENFVSDELDKVRKRSYRHLHPLIFKNKLTAESKVECSRCQKTISGPYYQCFLGCDEYIFHKDCGEHPGNLEQVGKNCPKYLRVTEPEYLFPKKSNCKICEYKSKEFSDGCHDCLFQTNMEDVLDVVVLAILLVTDATIATLICMSAACCCHKLFRTTTISIPSGLPMIPLNKVISRKAIVKLVRRKEIQGTGFTTVQHVNPRLTWIVSQIR